MIAQHNSADLVNEAVDFRVLEDGSRPEESLWISNYPTLSLWL
jgi:hypothetical protein